MENILTNREAEFTFKKDNSKEEIDNELAPFVNVKIKE
jgi:hypothetical protein